MRRAIPTLVLLLTTSLLRAENAPLETDVQKTSYLVGRQVGESLRAQGLKADPALLGTAMMEALDGKPSQLTPEETQTMLQELSGKVAARNLADGKAFLAANKKKKGVKTTKSGLQYKVEKPGVGVGPKATDRVKVHYRGTLWDGTEFDSSYKRGEPIEFPLANVIKGWTEGLQLMKPGGKFIFTIPPDLAYGPNGRPGIPPNSVLVFEVELLEIPKHP